MKTKEEIFCKHLGEYVPCELKSVVLTYVETRVILAAVQEYADQEKQALKEKIKIICQDARMDDRISATTVKLIIDQF